MADDISHDALAGLANWSAKHKQEIAAAQGQATVQPTTDPNNNSSLPPTDLAQTGQVVKATSAPLNSAATQSQASPPASVTPAPATPPDSPAAASAEPVKDPELQDEPWDKDLFTEPVKDEPLTLETLGSALKLPKAPKTTNELVEHFTAQEARIKELETTSKTNELFGLDDDLVEVVKAAKSGVDWKEYMSSRVVNYNNADPELLFDSSVQQDPRFKRPDGSIDIDAIDAELSAIPLAVKRAQGNLIKQNLINAQEQRRQNILRVAEQRQAEFHRNLATAAQEVPKILSKDKFGIPLEPKHVEFLYDGIRNGSLVSKHFGSKLDIGSVDPSKLVRTIALAEFGENIAKFNKSQGIVEGKKQLLAKSQNVNLNTTASTSPPDPTIQGQKPQTAAQKLQARFAKPTGVPTL